MPKEIEPFRQWWRSLTQLEKVLRLRSYFNISAQNSIDVEYTDDDILAMYNKQHPIVNPIMPTLNTGNADTLVLVTEEVGQSFQNRPDFDEEATPVAELNMGYLVPMNWLTKVKPTQLPDDYWKQRCLAAELIINSQSVVDIPEILYNRWLNLKAQSHE